MEEKEIIGGYFELELSRGQEYHNGALRFNTARNALCYYLKKKSVRRLHLPLYMPGTVLKALEKHNIEAVFYRLDQNLRPQVEHSSNNADEAFLAVNYFGVSDTIVKDCFNTYPNVIADNSQAFFTHPEKNCCTFYSARKFFGVADGAYLYADIDHDGLEADASAQRYMAQLIRMDGDIENGAFVHRNSEQLLGRQPAKVMSFLTQRILKAIRYDIVWERREANFRLLHQELGAFNQLKIDAHATHGAVVYPFLYSNANLKDNLHKAGVLTHAYWPEVLNIAPDSSIEAFLSRHIIGLPIDQRYGFSEMDKIAKTVKRFIHNNGAGHFTVQREINLLERQAK